MFISSFPWTRALDGLRPPPDGCAGTQGDAGAGGAGHGDPTQLFWWLVRKSIGVLNIVPLFLIKKNGTIPEQLVLIRLTRKNVKPQQIRSWGNHPINRDPARPNTITIAMWGWIIPPIYGNLGVCLLLLGLAHMVISGLVYCWTCYNWNQQFQQMRPWSSMTDHDLSFGWWSITNFHLWLGMQFVNKISSNNSQQTWLKYCIVLTCFSSVQAISNQYSHTYRPPNQHRPCQKD